MVKPTKNKARVQLLSPHRLTPLTSGELEEKCESCERRKVMYPGSGGMKMKNALQMCSARRLVAIREQVPPSCKERCIQSVDQMFVSFFKQLPSLPNPSLSRETSRSPPSSQKSSGILNSMGFREELGRSTGSTSRLLGRVRPKRENENGATTSARSKSSGWLQTFLNCITKFMSERAESASPRFAALASKSATETLAARTLYNFRCRALRST